MGLIFLCFSQISSCIRFSLSLFWMILFFSGSLGSLAEFLSTVFRRRLMGRRTFYCTLRFYCCRRSKICSLLLLIRRPCLGLLKGKIHFERNSPVFLFFKKRTWLQKRPAIKRILWGLTWGESRTFSRERQPTSLVCVCCLEMHTAEKCSTSSTNNHKQQYSHLQEEARLLEMWSINMLKTFYFCTCFIQPILTLFRLEPHLKQSTHFHKNIQLISKICFHM